MNHPSNIAIRSLDANGLAGNTEPAILVVVITRKEIGSGNVSSALERLHVLTDSAENVNLYRESVLFQFDGYQNDPRELCEIPEVRAYFHTLAQAWPHFLWFTHRGAGAIALLLSLLCQVRVIRSPETGFGTEFTDTDEIKLVLLDFFNRGMALFSTYQIPSRFVNETVSSALEELGLGVKQ